MKNFYIALAFYAIASLSPAYGVTTSESIVLAKDIKIADVHMHLSGESTQALLEKMNRSGIAWGGGVGGIRPDGPVRVKAALGKRYIAALGQAEYQAVLMEKGDLPPINRTSHISKKSITLENDGHENKQI